MLPPDNLANIPESPPRLLCNPSYPHVREHLPSLHNFEDVYALVGFL